MNAGAREICLPSRRLSDKVMVQWGDVVGSLYGNGTVYVWCTLKLIIKVSSCLNYLVVDWNDGSERMLCYILGARLER